MTLNEASRSSTAAVSKPTPDPPVTCPAQLLNPLVRRQSFRARPAHGPLYSVHGPSNSAHGLTIRVRSPTPRKPPWSGSGASGTLGMPELGDLAVTLDSRSYVLFGAIRTGRPGEECKRW